MPEEIRVAIISDGKAGHLHQSEGVASRLPGAEVKTFRIQYEKSRFYYRLVFAVRFVPGSKAAWARLGIGDQALNELLEFKPQVIVSTGALTAPMNLLCGRLAGARKVVCMRPNLLPLSAFDLVVVPEHDSPAPAPNILTTAGAVNIVDPNKVSEQARTFASQRGISADRKTIGILLGGDSKIYKMESEPVKAMLDAVSGVCARLGAQWMITTSRRTPEAVDAVVENHAAGDPNCVYCLIARKEPFNPVSEIVGLSKVVIATQDSVSMVSEAASAGRRVIVAPVDKRSPGPVKYERMFFRLEELGYARAVQTGELDRALKEELGREGHPEPLNDGERAARAVLKLL